MLQIFKNDFFKQKKNFQRSQWLFHALLGSVHQTYKVVFLLFDGHLTAIFDATKLPQFLALPIFLYYILSHNEETGLYSWH